jgi:flagellar assembly protein FliH
MKMSSSCNPAPKLARAPEVHPFLYAEVAAQTGSGGSAKSTPAEEPARDLRGGEVMAQREAAAREAGRREGEAQGRAAGAEQLAQVRASVTASLTSFAGDRTQYYQRVETEVVQLALAIARKILHREAQVDPLLLAGLVRVTLEKIGRATKVVLRVHPHQVSECRSYFAQHMETNQIPEVVEDPAMQMDHCALETALGKTEVGVEVQLKEIEQGLFDLMAKRPAAV